MVAVAVYDGFGLVLLRKSWLNVDLAWAAALLLSGLYILAPGIA